MTDHAHNALLSISDSALFAMVFLREAYPEAQGVRIIVWVVVVLVWAFREWIEAPPGNRQPVDRWPQMLAWRAFSV